ncbi:hypothetical protein Q8A73_023240 [Channa argus]|nr:hypothetical protein Q8A73_023240 [Channa argus]
MNSPAAAAIQLLAPAFFSRLPSREKGEAQKVSFRFLCVSSADGNVIQPHNSPISCLTQLRYTDGKVFHASLCRGEQQYHSKIDVLIDEVFKEMISSLVSKFAGVLDGVLSKLSRYDEGTFFSSILSFTKPGMDLADTYITFVRQNQDILRDRINDELYIEKVFDQWYTSSMKAVCVWLTDRLDLQLHVYQLKTLIKIVKKTYRDFRLQGVLDGALNNKSYETVYNRLMMEEASTSVKVGDGLQGISMKDSDEEDD